MVGPCTFMPIHFQFPVSPIPFLPHELEVEKRQFSISVELETAIVYRKFDFAIYKRDIIFQYVVSDATPRG